MELDRQKFFQNLEQLQFEFPPFPTSYMRVPAHQVVQHCVIHFKPMFGCPMYQP
ncbi:unnamed protein product [Arabidopsis halleri]